MNKNIHQSDHFYSESRINELIESLKKEKLKTSTSMFLMVIICSAFCFSAISSKKTSFSVKDFVITIFCLIILIASAYLLIIELLSYIKIRKPLFQYKVFSNGYFLYPLDRSKVAIERIKAIVLNSAELEIHYLELESLEMRKLSIPVSAFQDIENFMNSSIVKSINLQDLNKCNSSVDDKSPVNDSGSIPLIIDFISLIFDLFLFVISLWPLWIFIIMIILIILILR